MVTRPRHRAFTLIELILVMLVIAIAMAILVPSFSGTARGRRVGDTAGQIVSLTQYARSQAIAQGKTWRLNIDPDGGSYWLSVQDGAVYDNLQNWSFTLPDGIWVDNEIVSHDDGIYVEFRPSGRTDPANIRVRDEDGNNVVVVCESPTELFHILGN